ncbi:MAG TPA: HEPN domain-containing protein [Thermomicrobiales bacterium]|nr:HEPN domain-containing protein [Thermomicrobiales bacterium]
MRAETTAWWKHADEDLKTAAIVQLGGQFYATSWFCQQAVEKSLKAVYIERLGNLPPRTHDLEFLGNKLSVPGEVQSDLTIKNLLSVSLATLIPLTRRLPPTRSPKHSPGSILEQQGGSWHGAESSWSKNPT